MEQYIWIVWLLVGLLFIVAEIFTLGFVLFWFGIGAFAAGIASFLGLGYVWQFAVFALVSIVLTIMSRTIFEKYYPSKDGDGLKTGVDALPGTIGTVLKGSTGALKEATVKAYGSNWRALPAHGESEFVEGEKVEIVRVEGSTIYVKKADGSPRNWRD
ncbi:MAG: NfeD family protein [Pyrinomonadaceae bacterium]